jgi:hypothetical protein
MRLLYIIHGLIFGTGYLRPSRGYETEHSHTRQTTSSLGNYSVRTIHKKTFYFQALGYPHMRTLDPQSLGKTASVMARRPALLAGP